MSKDESIENLIAAGIITIIGIGLYKILQSFGNFKKDDRITANEILKNSSSIKCKDNGVNTKEITYSHSNSRKRISCGAYYLCSDCGHSEFFNSGKELICGNCSSHNLIDDDD